MHLIDLSFQARELLPDNTLGSQPGVSQTQAQVIISIQDTNNNPPVFEPNQYNAQVTENGLGDPCGRREIATLYVTDRDQVSFVKVAQSDQCCNEQTSRLVLTTKWKFITK